MLAGRGERFGAALIDGVIALATFLPLAALAGYFGKVMAAARGGEAMSLLAMAGYVALAFVVFMLV
ncbi:hypothetical protein [Xanthomonas cerealis]|uniref:hypothetical protein n=1 Tax=Xanthomonas cerealis TaxID=3390025 RepID=UPI000AD32F6C|nr:hypothetical protein [Xanthomonas translucens]